MLAEIKCDKFHIQPKPFLKGLNIVTGTNDGANSIGKTTFLMIIDYVFGGEDYILKSTDVQQNMGEHEICFKFIFNNEPFYFCRNTFESKTVYCCDDNYEKLDSMPLSQYLQFLRSQYLEENKDITFRDEVSNFMRIYGRDNIQEKKPLHTHPSEKLKVCIKRLLQLFDKFKSIAELEYKIDELNGKKKAINSAKKYSIVEKINATKYKENSKEIREITSEIDKLLHDYEHGLCDLDSATTEEVLQLKSLLSKLKISRSRYINEKNKLAQYVGGNFSDIQYEQLKSFFPNIDLKRIDEVHTFHQTIKSVLNEEIKDEEKRYDALINPLSEQILSIENQIKEKSNLKSLTKGMLQKLGELQKKKERMETQNELYTDYIGIVSNIKDLNNRLSEMKQLQLNQIENQINMSMEEINDFIYNKENKAPILSLQDTTYNFVTPDDSGTGTSYKSMIVYDLAILKLTDLPVLVHDSYLLKQIQDKAIERILQIYQNSNKQIFISIDKIDSLTEKTQEIVSQCEILHLYPNGGELFGVSWNKKLS